MLLLGYCSQGRPGGVRGGGWLLRRVLALQDTAPGRWLCWYLIWYLIWYLNQTFLAVVFMRGWLGLLVGGHGFPIPSDVLPDFYDHRTTTGRLGHPGVMPIWE